MARRSLTPSIVRRPAPLQLTLVESFFRRESEAIGSDGRPTSRRPLASLTESLKALLGLQLTKFRYRASHHPKAAASWACHHKAFVDARSDVLSVREADRAVHRCGPLLVSEPSAIRCSMSFLILAASPSTPPISPRYCPVTLRRPFIARSSYLCRITHFEI